MGQNKISVEQISSGTGEFDLGTRLNRMDSDIQSQKQTLTLINNAINILSLIPVLKPSLYTIETYIVPSIEEDISPVITIPNGKTYKVGTGNLIVFRNGIYQTLINGDYTEVSANTIQYASGVLEKGDIITFIICNSPTLNYNVNITYDEGINEDRIKAISFTGDIEKTVMYSYSDTGKLISETVVGGGKTLTKIYKYDEITDKLVGVTVSVS